LAIAGIVGGAYYFYAQGTKTPVAAAMVPSRPVLTNPEEWIDFKVPLSFPSHLHSRFVLFLCMLLTVERTCAFGFEIGV
jgi:hypothetical protein